MARVKASGAMVSVTGSTSAKTGRAPTERMARPVNAAVSGLVTTSSPGPTPRAMRAICRASVPLPTATAMRNTEDRSELALEGLDLGPEDEPARVEHPREGRVDLRTQRPHAGAEVDEGNTLRSQSTLRCARGSTPPWTAEPSSSGTRGSQPSTSRARVVSA